MSEYKRKLASVQQISDILIHTNADSLELAIVLGWQVVIKKGEFKKGEHIIYLEIDSVCPIKPWSAFLEKCKYRIKTIKLRGQRSQGLILPLDLLGSESAKYKIGDDITDILEVTKYESPEEHAFNNQNQGSSKVSTFPSYLGFSKTDEPRIQGELHYLSLFEGKKWYATIKYDGTSSTFFINPEDKNELVVCSRNQKIGQPENIEESKNVYWQVAIKYNLKDILSKFPSLVIQGEICGPGIQGNKLGLKEIKLAIFTIYDLNKKQYCTMNEIINYCKEMGLDMVMIDSIGDSFNFTKDELLEKARGKYPGTKTDREGLVFRLQEEVYVDRERASFKVINNDFLEKEK